MQNIINKIQSGDISQNFLIDALIQHENKSVDEFNEVMDALDDRNSKLEEQNYILEKQNEALQVQEKNKAVLLKNEDDLKKQSVLFQQKAANLEHQLKVARKELKASKEQIKRNKKSMTAKDARIKRLERQGKGKVITDETLQPLTTVYSKDEDVLLIWPSQLELGVNGKKSKQTALLFTDRQGCYVTCFLDENNEVGFSTPIRNDAEISDRTKLIIQKNCIQVSNETAEFAQDWLYRVNVIQNGVIKPIDLTCFKGK